MADAGSRSPMRPWRRSKMAAAARVAICCPTIDRARARKLSSAARPPLAEIDGLQAVDQPAEDRVRATQ